MLNAARAVGVDLAALQAKTICAGCFASDNIFPLAALRIKTRNRFLREAPLRSFNAAALPCFNQALVRFIEHIAGQPVFLKIFGFAHARLSFYENARCAL